MTVEELLEDKFIWAFIGLSLGDALGAFGFDPTLPFSINWDIPLSHAVFIFCISIIISIYPAIRILALNPIKAMKK